MFQKRCVWLPVTESTPAGQKTLKDEIWIYGMKRIPFHCQREVLQTLVDGHQEPFHSWLGRRPGRCGICTKGQIPLSEHSHPGERQLGSSNGK